MADRTSREWDRSAYMSIRRSRDRVLKPLSGVLARWGVSPSTISLLGAALAAATLWSIDKASPLALLAFLAALACDALDGALARHTGTDSSGGKVIDHACDTATFLLILLAIARCGLASPGELSFSALLAVPLLVVAIQVRRRQSKGRQEPSGGFLAHVYKAPIYGAFLLYTAGSVDVLAAAIRLANITAVLSLALLIGRMLVTPRLPAPGRPW